jgi:hypothetical protein
MARKRTHRFASTITTALEALALVSVARTIGPRRVGRFAALVGEAYLARRHRNRSRR